MDCRFKENCGSAIARRTSESSTVYANIARSVLLLATECLSNTEQAAKKLEDEGKLRRNVEDRAREKREEQKARERIRAKLGVFLQHL